MSLHKINKSEINIYISKNVIQKLAITKKKIIFAAKRKGGLLFLKEILLFAVYDQPSLDKVQWGREHSR